MISARRIMVGFFFLIALSQLVIGPAYGLMWNGYLKVTDYDALANTLCYPTFALAKNSKSFGKFLRRYLNLFARGEFKANRVPFSDFFDDSPSLPLPGSKQPYGGVTT